MPFKYPLQSNLIDAYERDTCHDESETTHHRHRYLNHQLYMSASEADNNNLASPYSQSFIPI